MKHPIALFSLLLSLCSSADTIAWSGATRIPEARLDSLAENRLDPGEVARVEREGPYAELYIGGTNGNLRVADSSALRGYKPRTLDPTEYYVEGFSGWTYDDVAGTYTATQGQTNTIQIIAPYGVKIGSVEMRTRFTGEGLIPAQYTLSEETRSGNSYTWKCAFVRAEALVVDGITVKAVDEGEIDWENDAVATSFLINDALGLYDLKQLRTWARDLYNGNRGEDWAKYKAAAPVRLDGQLVRFAEDDRFTLSLVSPSNLVLQAAMRDAMEIKVRQAVEATSCTTIGVTHASIGTGAQGSPVTILFICDAAAFSTNNLGVVVSDKPAGGAWLGLEPSDYTVSNISTTNGFATGTVTIPGGVIGDMRFFKLRYGAATSDAVDIVLHGRVIVKDTLVLKGTDGKYYQINVNGGSISATEVWP